VCEVWRRSVVKWKSLSTNKKKKNVGSAWRPVSGCKDEATVKACVCGSWAVCLSACLHLLMSSWLLSSVLDGRWQCTKAERQRVAWPFQQTIVAMFLTVASVIDCVPSPTSAARHVESVDGRYVGFTLRWERSICGFRAGETWDAQRAGFVRGTKGAITSKIKHTIKLKASPARLTHLLHNCCSPR